MALQSILKGNMDIGRILYPLCKISDATIYRFASRPASDKIMEMSCKNPTTSSDLICPMTSDWNRYIVMLPLGLPHRVNKQTQGDIEANARPLIAAG